MKMGRVQELIDAWRDGLLTEATAAEFSQLLRDSDEARRIFRAEAQMHGLLHLAVMAAAVEEAASRGSRSMTPAASEGLERRWRRGVRITSMGLLAAGTAVLVAGVAATFIWIHISRPQPTSPIWLATLTRAEACVWEGPAQLEPGHHLDAGMLNLREGLAEIEMASGVDLLIEGPAILELIDAKSTVLNAGRIVARVQLASAVFAVDTPRARFVDLGTEFGVAVDPDLETVVQVFDGVVVAELKDSGPSGERNRRLVAGESVRIGASGALELQRTLFSPERFLRTFSTPSVHQGDELIPFTPSRISTLDVLPPSGRVTVDGDLSDWDRSDGFEARCAERFADSYYVQGNMMYDGQYLYAAARVGDPLPMRNAIDPNIDPWSAWMGGSVQLRFSTDRTFGWPLKALRGAQRRGGRDEKDTSDRLIHLTLWYFQPREQACLELRYGMDFDRGVVNPPGWRGAFRKAPDGKSYTMECAIPWTLLGAGNDPPRPGDTLGVCWTVNWSDASGMRWKGQLVEIKNPAYADRGKRLTFEVAETWGKAVYR